MTVPLPRSVHRSGQLIHLLVAVPLGVVFAIAGAAKSLDLPSLVSTIGELTGTPPGAAMVLALLLIVAEIVGGLLLILGIGSRVAALALSALMVAFILTPLVLEPEALRFQCNCFGPLTPAMSLQARLVLDLALLDLLLLVALAGPPRRARLSRLAPAALAMLALLQLAALLAGSSDSPTDLRAALEHATLLDTLFAATSGNRAILLLDFTDFRCPSCYDNIYRTTDTLSRRQGPGTSHRALILLRSKGWSLAEAKARARRWRETAGITLPTYTIGDSLFTAAGETGSSVAVFDTLGKTVFRKTFPLRDQDRHHLVRLLFPLHNIAG